EREGAMRTRVVPALMLISVLCGCGYRTAGRADRLPPDVRTIAVPAFDNRTQTYRVEQVLTAAVVQEFNTRTRYRISSNAESNADAVLRGAVLLTEFSPVTYDSVTGRASSALVTVTVQVSLVDRNNQVLWENPSYTFREQYQVSRELSSFFEEDQPAVDRLARDFARTLVSNIVEAY
ncbi:MAG: LPS assembly lipoprotein LptE, partial [Candidatus Korobacteraceae bacterium]